MRAFAAVRQNGTGIPPAAYLQSAALYVQSIIQARPGAVKQKVRVAASGGRQDSMVSQRFCIFIIRLLTGRRRNAIRPMKKDAGGPPNGVRLRPTYVRNRRWIKRKEGGHRDPPLHELTSFFVETPAVLLSEDRGNSRMARNQGITSINNALELPTVN